MMTNFEVVFRVLCVLRCVLSQSRVIIDAPSRNPCLPGYALDSAGKCKKVFTITSNLTSSNQTSSSLSHQSTFQSTSSSQAVSQLTSLKPRSGGISKRELKPDADAYQVRRGLKKTISHEEAVDESIERRRREAPKTENSNSQFIRSEKTTTGDNIIWRDNSETRKQGMVPTVRKVLHHGIYPSLEITEPLNGSHVGKYRQKRAVGPGSSQGASDANSELSTSSIGTVSINELGDGWQTEGRVIGTTKSTIDNMLVATRQYSQPRETRTPYPIPEYQNPRGQIVGNHYHQADHSANRLNNAYLSLDDNPPTDYAQGSIRYRTMYLPSNSEYKGDPENKGRVKLISVGYYGVNESTADLRSYRNPKVDRRPRTTTIRPSRAKRDTHWCWLDKFFKSIWIMKNPETGEQEKNVPRSEPLRMEANEVNEEAQDVYGYSSNGHGHPHAVDRIYLVQNEQIQNPHQNPNPHAQTSTSTTPPPHQPSPTPPKTMAQTTPNTTLEEMPLPADRPVLIQAPPRKIVCRPPKRLARGRCRTVW